MAMQAQWHDATFETTPDRIHTFGEISGSLGLDIEKTEDAEGEPPEEPARRKLKTFSISYEFTTSAGIDPMAEINAWDGRLSQGIHAPFYLGGEKFLADEFILKDVDFKLQHITVEGKPLTGEITLKFEEYAEEESGMKTDKGAAVKLTPGVQDYYGDQLESALNISASESDKQRLAILEEKGYG